MFQKIREQNLWKYFWNSVYVKICQICYYPGFYRSLKDEMGPNGEYFEIKLNLDKSMIKSSILELIVWKLIQFSVNIMIVDLIQK